LLDGGEKRGIVERAVEDRGRGQTVDAEAGDDGVRLPVAARRVFAQAHATGTSCAATIKSAKVCMYIIRTRVAKRVMASLKTTQ
jgi:hypothetical protein